MTQEALQDKLTRERVRAMLAGYTQAERGQQFSEKMEDPDVNLRLINQHVAEVIGEPNDAMPSPQVYYEDTPQESVYAIGKNDGRNLLIVEQRKRAGL